MSDQDRHAAASALADFADEFESAVEAMERPLTEASAEYWRGADDAASHAVASMRSKAMEILDESSSFDNSAYAWKRRWEEMRAKSAANQQENARLRAALDELNGDVEGFLSIAYQAGHEEAKSHMIRTQAATIRAMRDRLRVMGGSEQQVRAQEREQSQ